jgi:tRNA(His) 5'-end guanylyltransferase
LNSHCYWILRKDNYSKREATSKLKGLSTADKNELLFKYGINFNELPKWQKRGVGIYWEDIVKEGFDPVLKQKKCALRRKLKVDLALPMRDEYDRFILKIIESNENTRDQQKLRTASDSL